MTYEELTKTEPKPRGEVVLAGTDGKQYKTFVCHGCQSCWCINPDDDSLEESYPHFLAPFEEVTS